METNSEDFQTPTRLNKRDVANFPRVGDAEIIFLVKRYYDLQDERLRASGRSRSLAKNDEPHEAIAMMADQAAIVEHNAKLFLDAYAQGCDLGVWLLGLRGIGPVLAAGTLAYFPASQVPTTVGKWWSLAGYNPEQKWKKGEKRPWSAERRRFCWRIGDSFVKQGDKGFYPRLYREYKAAYVARNERGDNAELALRTLEERTFRDAATRKMYESGRLPDGRVDLQARRKTVKLFLSHYHELAWQMMHPGEELPKPYAIGILGHANYIPPPEDG